MSLSPLHRAAAAFPGFVWFALVVIVVLAMPDRSASARPADPPRFGRFLSQITGLHDPNGVAIGPDGRIFIADTDAGVIRVLSREGETLAELNAPAETSVLSGPMGVAVDEDGFVYVADTGNDRVVVFDDRGRWRATWGKHGPQPTRFIAPEGITVHGDLVYVADTGNQRVQVFGRNSSFKFAFGERGVEDGQFLRPTGVAVDEAGSVFVVDADRHRVQKFDAEGTLLMGWGDYGFFPGLFASPRGIAVHQGLLLVAEAFSHRVQAFDLDGSFLYQWGLHAVVPREGEGKIHYPQGVAVAPDGSFVAVVEPFEDRCQLFGPLGGEDESAPVPPAPSSAVSHFGPQLDVSGRWLAVHEPEQGSLSIFDLSHEVPILVSTVGEPGRRVGQLSRVADLSIDDTQVLVADAGTSRLQRFRFDLDAEGPTRFDPLAGRLVKAYDSSLLRFGEDEPVPLPVAVDHDEEGNIYLLDGRSDRVLVFTAEMKPLRSWGGSGSELGRFRGPTDLLLDRAGERVYVVDALNHRVQTFDLNGEFLFAFGKQGTGAGEFVSPFGIATSPDGFIYVTDSARDVVQKFDTRGSFVAAWGSQGGDAGQFWKPKGIVVDDRLRLIVVDYGNHRLQVFSPEGEWLVTFGAGRAYTRPKNSPAS